MRAPISLTHSPAFWRTAPASTLVLACALLAPAAATQEHDDPLTLLYGDEETISIATGTKKPLRLAPSVASVITSEDIEAMGALTLDEVLEAVPGVHVSLSSRYSSLISIRGIHTRLNPQVLLLINGFPITELFTGGRMPTFRLPVQNIQRVEVIRGPGSAVYGADAFAGVINVITKGTDELPDFQLGTTAGSFDTYGGWLQGSTAWMGWDLGVSLELLHSNGDQGRIIERDLQSTLDAVLGTTASLAPGPAATGYDILNSHIQMRRPHWQMSLNSWKQDEGGLGAGVAEALDPHGFHNGEQHLFELAFSSEDDYEDWQLSGRLNYFRMAQDGHYNILPPGTVLPIGNDGNLDFSGSSPVAFVYFTEGLLGQPGGTEQTGAIELVASFTGFSGHRIRLAGGYKNQQEEVFERKNFGPGVIDGTTPFVDGSLVDVSDTPFVYIPDQERQIRHVSVQDEWSLYKDWELTAGVRYDDYSDFGSTLNPRAALVWQTSYNLTSKLLYGRAFRAPSFSEQFAINNPIILGNPQVEPEEIDTIELSFEYRPVYDVRTKLTAFRYDIEGIIDYIDQDGFPGGGSVARNVHDQQGHGMEIEASWQIRQNLSLAGHWSWQQSENSRTGFAVADAPGRLAYMDLRWQFAPAWTWTAQVNHVADRKRSPGDPREDVDDFTLLNLSLLSHQLTSFVDFSFSMHNALDEDAREPSAGPAANVPYDHPLAGRQFILEAVFRIP